MTDILTTPLTTDPELEDEEPKEAHIIAREDEASANAIITQAFVEGTPLVALCGKVWVPSRSAKNLPVCPRCLEAIHDIIDMRNSL